MYSSINKGNLFITFFLLMGMTSCCSMRCYQESVEIPCCWQTQLEGGVTDEPVTILWWESLGDSLLSELIKQVVLRNNDIQLAKTQSKEVLLETVNTITAETATNYIELRGLQQRLEIIQAIIEIQKKVIVIEEGLGESYISSLDQSESKKNLDSLLMQKSLMELSIKKVTFSLSTLLGYAPGQLCMSLGQTDVLPKLPCYIPVGLPIQLIEHHPDVREAKKIYLATRSEQGFYNYQKKILHVLEEAENALAAFLYSSEKIRYLSHSKRLKDESYQLIKDLYIQGFKNEQEVLAAYQDLLTQENALSEGKNELLINYVNLYKALSFGMVQKHAI